MGILRTAVFSFFAQGSWPFLSLFLLLSGLTGCADRFGSEPENDCLIVAAKAQVALPPHIWNRLLVVRYDDASLQHVYLVYETSPVSIVVFDNSHGTRHLNTSVRDSSALARLIDPFAKWGWYIEDNAHRRHLAFN
jgi:hypothetical protein